MKWACRLLGVLALVLDPVAAADFGLEDLMAQLARVPAGRLAFREEKTSALLSEPLVLEGTLTFRRPDYLSKEVERPFWERYEVEGDRVTLQRALDQRSEGTGARHLSLADYPPLRALVASLRATLTGDLETLQRYYRLELTGSSAHWRLILIPREPEMAEQVDRLVIRGREGRLDSVETLEAGGDRSLLRLEHGRQ